MKLSLSDKADKRLKAEFFDATPGLKVIKIKTVHFGEKDGSTFIDHKDEDKKSAYLKRHRALNENWEDPMTAGALSRWILWNKPTFADSVKYFKNKFNIK